MIGGGRICVCTVGDMRWNQYGGAKLRMLFSRRTHINLDPLHGTYRHTRDRRESRKVAFLEQQVSATEYAYAVTLKTPLSRVLTAN